MGVNIGVHHANILISKKDGRKAVFEILKEKLNFKVQANPDFLLMENKTFGIDEARDLKKWASGKPLLGETKACLVVADVITPEAQNAMLKVLEEPPLGTYIFINLENLQNLLPTFLSRVKVWRSDAEMIGLEENATEFIKADINKKLLIVRSLAFKKEGKALLKDLIKNLEKVAYRNPAMKKNMKNILTAKIFVTARGSSPKILAEWLASVL